MAPRLGGPSPSLLRCPQAGGDGFLGYIAGTMRVLMNSNADLRECLERTTKEEEEEFRQHTLRGVDLPPADLKHELLCTVKPSTDPQNPRDVTLLRSIELTALKVRARALCEWKGREHELR